MEKWRDIPGFEGIYQASTEGRIKSVDRYITHKNGKVFFKKGKILTFLKRSDGRLMVNLGDKNRNVKVHQLITSTFPDICGEPFPDSEIDHIDGNPANNSPYNLRFVDHKTNMNNPATVEKLKKVIHPQNRKDLSKPVEQYTLNGVLIAVYPSSQEVERQTGFKQGNISTGIKYGRIRYGYIWKYKTLPN